MQRFLWMLAVGALAVPIATTDVRAGADCEQRTNGAAAMKDADAAADVQVIAKDAPQDADNTARNERDRDDDATLTPMDQGGSEADRTITQQIRKAVVDRDGLSVNAQNVKIITVDGVVTLRGPVKTTEEKTTIASIARLTAGVKRVDDQLEVEHDD